MRVRVEMYNEGEDRGYKGRVWGSIEGKGWDIRVCVGMCGG